MREQIGLVIWGCKGGYRAFCSNNVVNTGEQVISQTIKDIRSFIRIHRTGHDFYAIEFTPKFKVFTNYRSSNDSGTGAFIAFTIYVPHNLKLMNMRAMFKEMMDGYFHDYMNPLSNTPLTGKYDDINKFSPILERYEIKPDRPYFRLSSKQDDKPNLVVYDDLSVVDKYFDSPYRPEFYNCQEVMFLSKEIYNNPTNYEVEFVIKPTIIEHISEPEAESTLINNLAGLKLSSLVINGEDMLHTNGNCPLSESDTISFSISKNNYFDDFKTGSYSPEAPLTVQEAVRQGWLLLVNKKNYTFAQSYPMAPKSFRVMINNSGADMSKLKDILFLSDAQKFQVPLKENAGQFFYEFRGEEVCKTYTLVFSPVETSSKDKQGFVLQPNIIPEQYLNTGITTDIVRRTFHKATSLPKEFVAEIKLNNDSLRWKYSGNNVAFYLPASRLHQVEFGFTADDYDVSIDGDEISFTPTYVSVFINRGILNYNDYRQLKYVLQIDNKEYESIHDVASKRCYFRLPYNVWKCLKSGQYSGSFSCNSEILDYSLNNSGDELLFSAVFIRSQCPDVIDVTIRKGERTDIMPIGRDGLMVLPKGTEASVDGLKAKLIEKDSSDRMSLSIIEPVIATSIQVDDDPEKGINTGDINPPKQRYVVLSGCTKFFIKSGGKHTPVTEEHQRMPFKDNVRLYDKDGVVVCHAKYGGEGNLSSDRDAKYFTVIWNGDNCEIEYKKDSVLDKILQFKKWIGGIGALIVLIGLIWGLTPLVKNLFTSDKEYTITIDTEGIDNIIVIDKQLQKYELKKQGNKWVFVFQVPSDKKEVDEIYKLLISDKQMFNIVSENHGNIEKTSFKAINYQNLRNYLSFLDSFKSGKEPYDITISVELPSEKKYNELKKDSSLTVWKCAQAAQNYPGKKDEFIELAYDLATKKYADESDHEQKLKDFQDCSASAKYPLFYNREKMDYISKTLNEILNERNNQESRQARMQAIDNQINNQNWILDKLNVGKNNAEEARLKAIELLKATDLEQEQIKKLNRLKERAEAYITLFTYNPNNPNENDSFWDLKVKPVEKYLGRKQKEIFKQERGYGGGPKPCKKLFKEVDGINFEEAEKWLKNHPVE